MTTRILLCVILVSSAPVLADEHLSYIYGGPGTLEGKFQTASGNIDVQQWFGTTCLNLSPLFYWQVSDFQAEGLNGHGPGNLAMWAGQTAEQQPGWFNPPGYGDNWDTRLTFARAVPNPSEPFTAGLEFYYQQYIELFYDFVLVEWNQAGTWVLLDSYQGFPEPDLFFQHTWTVNPADLVGSQGDELQIRLRVTSDGAISDECCGQLLFSDTDGATQVDDIVVTIDGVPLDNGGDPDGVATFEGGDDEGWTPEQEPCNCSILPDFAGDLDPRPDNLTPVLVYRGSGPDLGEPSCFFWRRHIPWDVANGAELDGAVLRLDTYSTADAADAAWSIHLRTPGGGVDLTPPLPVTGGTWRTMDFDLSGVVPIDAPQIDVMILAERGTATEVDMAWDNVEIYRYDTSAVAVADSQQRPLRIVRVQPNPLNPAATVTYSTPGPGPVRLDLYDVRGRHLRTLVDASLAAGEHTAFFDGRDEEGSPIASGTYFLSLSGHGATHGSRLTLLR